MTALPPALRLLRRRIYKVFEGRKPSQPCLLSEVIGDVDIGPAIKSHRFVKFPEKAMANAMLFMQAKNIRFQSELARYLRKHREDATNLGFLSKTPNQRTFSYYMNHAFDGETRAAVDFLAKSIAEISDKYGIVMDIEHLKSSAPKKKRCKKTIFNITKERCREVCRVARRKIFPCMKMDIRHNSVYKDSKYKSILLHVAMTGDFTEDGFKTFAEQYKGRVPDASTFLSRNISPVSQGSTRASLRKAQSRAPSA